jgi:predicted  nucleic acid-binding Zn-ribbon protein
LTQEFEAALRETELRRVGLHAEMDDLRRREQTLLQRLPDSVSRAYESLRSRGCTPAVVAVANGACDGCEAPLPESVIDALSQGAVVVCARCERFLRLTRPVE